MKVHEPQRQIQGRFEAGGGTDWSHHSLQPWQVDDVSKGKGVREEDQLQLCSRSQVLLGLLLVDET